MTIAIDLISVLFLVIGSFFAVIGGVGIVRLPEFFSRMHGAGITDTMGAGMIMVGLMFQAGMSLVTVKLLMILFFLLITSPSSCHALAKAAMTHGLRPELDAKTQQARQFKKMNLIVFPILALLAATAVTVARMRDLWAAIMFLGIYSFLSASWMLILDAPDVAFTEAAVGAGISTVLMLSTLALTGKKERATTASPLVPLFVVTVTGFALVYGTLDMPHFGDPDAPIHKHPNPSFVERAQPDMHDLPNVVTAVLASYRGYDTLGETAVIFTAGVAVLLILRRHDEPVSSGEPASVTEGAK